MEKQIPNELDDESKKVLQEILSEKNKVEQSINKTLVEFQKKIRLM